MDWRDEFFEFDDVTYLNAAGQGPMPRVSVRAAQAALEWKKFPHLLSDDQYFGLPDRVRSLVARLIQGQPHEVAITTGATGGLQAVAAGIDWQPDDEVLVARREFPAHFTTWRPLADSGRFRLLVIEPGSSGDAEENARSVTADDFLANISRHTRLVSVSFVRFDNAARLDTRHLADACHSLGAYLLLDVSQCAGALPLDARALGADFLVCAGYKWLLSPYGTGFFWVREDLVDEMRPGPFYWMAVEGAAEFHSLMLDRPELVPKPREARRWDSPETSSFFNLAAMEASLEFILRVGVETIYEHNDRLIRQMIERLPLDRCLLASPRDAAARGPFACVAGRSPEKSRALFEKLREAKVIVSLRENALRVAPHLYNTERDIDRLLEVLAV